MLVASAFTEIRIHSVAVTLLVFTMTAVLFALGGFINAIYANSFDDISIVPTFVLTPLTYLGGVFYSIELLPGFGRACRSPIRSSTWSTPSDTDSTVSATSRSASPSGSSRLYPGARRIQPASAAPRGRDQDLSAAMRVLAGPPRRPEFVVRC
jgi:hypothetical protein